MFQYGQIFLNVVKDISDLFLKLKSVKIVRYAFFSPFTTKLAGPTSRNMVNCQKKFGVQSFLFGVLTTAMTLQANLTSES